MGKMKPKYYEKQKALMQYRRENKLCIECGDHVKEGRTRCAGCLQMSAFRARQYRAAWSPERKQKQKEDIQRWLDNHPEYMDQYNARRKEYNRRYREKNGY